MKVTRCWLRFGIVRHLSLVLAASTVLLALLATGATAQTSQLRVWSLPSLFPSFSTSVTDYVVRCEPTNSVRLFVSAPANTRVSVDGLAPRTGAFSQVVNLSSGQSFQISVVTADQSTNHFIRCLPSDFPKFTATRTGTTQAEWYILTPNTWAPRPVISREYSAIFDNNGVPVWWMKADGPGVAVDAKLLPNGDLVWLQGAIVTQVKAAEHRLDGSAVRTLTTVGNVMDQHDIALLPNGNYVLGRTFLRQDVDMTACGGPTSGPLLDFELQVLTPGGDLVWSWRASDHIPLSELPPEWHFECTFRGDVYHWNSVDPVGNDYVISFRHLDAVFRIDGATGAIEWKLGGTPRPESLAVVGDPLAGQTVLDGQHDARMLPDGSLTVFDNGTIDQRPPRDVRFAIDENTRTATLLESISNPDVSYVSSVGSARKLPGGDWVTSWGDSGYETEQTSTGETVFQLDFSKYVFSYRAYPVLPGVLTAEQLRAGMDAQYPRD